MTSRPVAAASSSSGARECRGEAGITAARRSRRAGWSSWTGLWMASPQRTARPSARSRSRPIWPMVWPGRRVSTAPGASSSPSSTRSTRPASTSGRTLSRRPRTCIGSAVPARHARLPVGELRCGRPGSGHWGRSRAQAAVAADGVPADMVDVQMGAEHGVDASGATPTARSRSSQPVPERRFQAGISGRSLCSPMQASTRIVRPPSAQDEGLDRAFQDAAREIDEVGLEPAALGRAGLRGRGRAGSRAAAARNRRRRRSRRRRRRRWRSAWPTWPSTDGAKLACGQPSAATVADPLGQPIRRTRHGG